MQFWMRMEYQERKGVVKNSKLTMLFQTGELTNTSLKKAIIMWQFFVKMAHVLMTIKIKEVF